jgi:hypothetical protein
VKAVHVFDSARYAVIPRFKHEQEGRQGLPAQSHSEELLA